MPITDFDSLLGPGPAPTKKKPVVVAPPTPEIVDRPNPKAAPRKRAPKRNLERDLLLEIFEYLNEVYPIQKKVAGYKMFQGWGDVAFLKRASSGNADLREKIKKLLF